MGSSVRREESIRTVPHGTAHPSPVAGRRFARAKSRALVFRQKNCSGSPPGDGSVGNRPLRAWCVIDRYSTGMQRNMGHAEQEKRARHRTKIKIAPLREFPFRYSPRAVLLGPSHVLSALYGLLLRSGRFRPPLLYLRVGDG